MKNKFTKQLVKYEKLSRELEPSSEQFKNDINHISGILLRYHKIAKDLKGKDNFLYKTFPEDSDIFSKAIRTQITGGIETASGNFMGYVPGGGLLTSAYADFITAITNKYSGLAYAAPGAASVENSAISWMIDIFKFGDQAWGALTSGGTSATLNCFMAALETVKFEDRSKLQFYITNQTHHCVKKVLKVMGL